MENHFSWKTAAFLQARRKTTYNSPRNSAALCDTFVQGDFSTAHRAESMTCGIAETAPIACASLLLTAEMDVISKALAEPKSPFVDGFKVRTKLTILKSDLAFEKWSS